MNSHFIWVEKYRPTKLEDIILPKRLKDMFGSLLTQGDIPSVLFVGPPGTGKTTVARSLAEALSSEVMFIPASLNRGIDMLRSEIMPFASAVSWDDKRKYVILDEADNLTFDTQKALRNFMEQYALTTGFILTANHPNRIHEAIVSRGPIVDFTPSAEESTNLCVQFLHRAEEILKIEGIAYDKAAVAAVVRDHFPDYRSILGVLQLSVVDNRIALDTVVARVSFDFDELFSLIRSKNYLKLRQWVSDHSDTDFNEIYRQMYEFADKYFTRLYLPQFILVLSDYMYKAALVRDQEINFCAFCIEVWKSADWIVK